MSVVLLMSRRQLEALRHRSDADFIEIKNSRCSREHAGRQRGDFDMEIALREWTPREIGVGYG